MGADRRSALGRLEAQHEQEMKAQALDEDALLEAAIQHNQVAISTLSSLQQYMLRMHRNSCKGPSFRQMHPQPFLVKLKVFLPLNN
jgi:hypothetical protein